MFGSSIGIEADKLEDLIIPLKEGLPVSSLHRLCENIGVPENRMALTVNIAQRTLTRRKKEGRLKPDESERVLRIARIYERAVEVMGDQERARQWFRTKVKGLGGNTPLEFADTEPGAQAVSDLLGRIEDGVFY